MVNTIIQGDCLDVMKDIKDNSIDMMLCDLPYGTTPCKWDVCIPFEPLWKQCKRIAKSRAAILFFGSQPFTTLLNSSNFSWYKYEWIWIKPNITGYQDANRRPLKCHEIISVFYKKAPVYNPQGLILCNKRNRRSARGSINPMKNETNSYKQEFTNYPKQLLYFPYDNNKFHPTQKPVKLCEYLIKTYTNPGQLVLDFCIGSGSTIIGCINTERDFLGIEKDEHFFKIAKKRIDRKLKGGVQLDFFV